MFPCWSCVADGGPTLIQHRINVSYLLWWRLEMGDAVQEGVPIFKTSCRKCVYMYALLSSSSRNLLMFEIWKYAVLYSMCSALQSQKQYLLTCKVSRYFTRQGTNQLSSTLCIVLMLGWRRSWWPNNKTALVDLSCLLGFGSNPGRTIRLSLWSRINSVQNCSNLLTVQC